MSYLIYIILCFVYGGIITFMGYGFNTWQFWIMGLCVCGSYYCGRKHK